jgi:D-aminopeptidase
MDRTLDNLSSRLVPVSAGTADDVAGRYRCEALGTELEIVDAGGALYGAFAGFLGRGRMELLDPVGPDLWALPCPRALDHSPPGDWTLAFRRDESGRAACVSVGCWLARGFSYERVG